MNELFTRPCLISPRTFLTSLLRSDQRRGKLLACDTALVMEELYEARQVLLACRFTRFLCAEQHLRQELVNIEHLTDSLPSPTHRKCCNPVAHLPFARRTKVPLRFSRLSAHCTSTHWFTPSNQGLSATLIFAHAEARSERRIAANGRAHRRSLLFSLTCFKLRLMRVYDSGIVTRLSPCASKWRGSDARHSVRGASAAICRASTLR